jgi:drug/metabolite transporter (DMT)-like permease
MNPPAAHRPPLALLIAAFAAVYLIWGSTYLAIKYAIETLPPFLMAGMRFTLAGLLVYGWMRLRQHAPAPTRVHWRSAFNVGGLLLLGGNGLICWAELHVPSGLAALLVATVPMWMVILDWLFTRGPRPTVAIAVGLVIGLLGVLVLVNPIALKDQPIHPLGAAAILAACLSWSIGSLYSRAAPLPRQVMLTVGMEMIGGGALLLIVGSLRGEWSQVNLEALSFKSIAAFAYLVVIGALVGYTAYIWLLQVASPAAVSTYAFVNPVVAVLLGWVADGEPMGPRVVIASALIVGAVALITLRRSKRPPPQPPSKMRSLKDERRHEHELCATGAAEPL